MRRMRIPCHTRVSDSESVCIGKRSIQVDSFQLFRVGRNAVEVVEPTTSNHHIGMGPGLHLGSGPAIEKYESHDTNETW